MHELKTPQSTGKKRLYILLSGVFLLAAFCGGRALLHWRADQIEQKFFTAAVEAREAEDWELLREISERWVSHNTDSGTGWLALADSCQSLGDLECAQSALGKIAPTDPHYLEARALRGDLLYLDLKRPSEAESNWREMLEIDSASAEAYQGLISFYALSVQRHKMMETIRDAIAKQCEPPESYVYLILSDRLSFGTGKFRIDEWLEKEPDNQILEVAHAYYVARHNDSSTQSVQETNSLYQGNWSKIEALISRYPENLNVLAFQIESALIDGKTSVAIDLLNQLPNEAAEDFRFWRFRARSLLESGAADQAINAARTSLQMNPYDWRSRVILAEAFRILQQPENARLEAELGAKGKALEKTLLSLQNPLDFWEMDLRGVYEYVQIVGDLPIVEALRGNATFMTTEK
ncbi:MAG: hypothetical protein P8M30_17770 [Planctomycetaceae bacterium]|nr:hypothetical protein [Planctomycetaceae bacterium]